jgi:hypothetical protein
VTVVRSFDLDRPAVASGEDRGTFGGTAGDSADRNGFVGSSCFLPKLVNRGCCVGEQERSSVRLPGLVWRKAGVRISTSRPKFDRVLQFSLVSV